MFSGESRDKIVIPSRPGRCQNHHMHNPSPSLQIQPQRVVATRNRKQVCDISPNADDGEVMSNWPIMSLVYLMALYIPAVTMRRVRVISNELGIWEGVITGRIMTERW